MSTVPTNIPAAAAVVGGHDAHNDGDGHGHHHDPHLAHHFDTPEQQFNSNKLGMWVFLGTEILMFGGLFCAYSVYRHNHPDIFVYAHAYLDKWLGALNTVILITSSLTMAWGVRAAQLGQTKLLTTLLIATLIGGAGFMVIKTVEYNKKWKHGLFVGPRNIFNGVTQGGKTGAEAHELEEESFGEDAGKGAEPATREGSDPHDRAKPTAVNPAPVAFEGSAVERAPEHGEVVSHAPGAKPNPVAMIPVGADAPDGNAGTDDKAKIVPQDLTPGGLSHATETDASHHHVAYRQLAEVDKHRVYTFFGIYFFMTGLHGLHVLIGMSLIFWVFVRALPPGPKRMANPLGLTALGLFVVVLGLIIASGWLIWPGLLLAAIGGLWSLMRLPTMSSAEGEAEFGPKYFYPVDLVGLYWHLVDLIWIFLFPLLYLIH